MYFALPEPFIKDTAFDSAGRAHKRLLVLLVILNGSKNRTQWLGYKLHQNDTENEVSSEQTESNQSAFAGIKIVVTDNRYQPHEEGKETENHHDRNVLGIDGSQKEAKTPFAALDITAVSIDLDIGIKRIKVERTKETDHPEKHHQSKQYRQRQIVA
jgi:hypothetical protein